MKYYFEAAYNDPNCYQLWVWKDRLIADELESIELVEAKIDPSNDYFFCVDSGECYEEGCGKECKAYEPRNGKSGRCRHHRKCYEPTDKKFTLTKDGKLIPWGMDEKAS